MSAHTSVEVVHAPAPCSLDELIRRAQPVLRAAGVHRAVAFGSWARGEADGFSAGESRGFGIFDAIAREGVEVYRAGPQR